MTDRPIRIGMSARLMHSPPKELGFPGKVLQYLERSVAHWIMTHGALAFMIPTLSKGGGVKRESLSVRDCVAAMDGLVLQGGADISPTNYGEEPLRPEWAGDNVRDQYEIELLWEFLIQGKPVLGICRGCQLINVACGGSLFQDIPSMVENAAQHRHDDLYDNFHHEIQILPGSRLSELFPEETRPRVNSIHHQCVRKLGRDLCVEAISPADGVIEAIRWNGSGFMLGCQWHPEFQGAGLLDSAPIMQEFLDAARRAMRN